MKAVNNFINQEHFEKLQKYMFSAFFPWYYNPTVVFENDPLGSFQFTHMFYNNESMLKSEYFDLLKPILDNIKPFALCRIKANVLTKTNEIIEHGYHTDFEKDERVTTAIFYLNTNNGYTKFKSGEKVSSVANKFIEFNSTEMHTGSTCTDENIRMVINLNYIKQKMEEKWQ